MQAGLWENRKKKREHFVDLSVDGKIIWSQRNRMGECELGYSCLG